MKLTKVSLKVEEKVDRKTQQKLRGRGPRGRGRTNIAKENDKEEESTSSQSSIGNGAGRGRGFRRGKGKFVITCYRCGVEGHKAWNAQKSKVPVKEVMLECRLPWKVMHRWLEKMWLCFHMNKVRT
jgi:hypothetical protein